MNHLTSHQSIRSAFRLPVLLALQLLISSPLAHAQDTPIINEFMASNDDTLTLPGGESPDWIELHNSGDSTFDLAGWSLSDNAETLNKWTFPTGASIPANGYLLVYATGENLSDPSAELHTNFSLGQNGEFLALVSPQGVIAEGAFTPNYPAQFKDVSYGFPTGQSSAAYFNTPSPGEANNDSIQGFVKDTTFSHKRGFFEETFQLQITTATPGASIYYTLDGSDPSPSSPSIDAPNPESPPLLSLDISTTTIVRAYADKSGFQKTNTDTQTYLFLDEVISNPVMATSVTEHSVWGPQMHDALLEIPTISLVTQEAIPTTPIMSPPEIPVSIEMIFPDGKDGFQLDAGVERFGGQYTVYEKHALRVSFKEIYGKKKLKFDLFSDTPYGGDTAVESFDQILLRNGSHDSLFATNYSHSRGIYVRNRYFFDRQLEAGHLSMRGKFVHVYLNGTYYGQHHLMERPNADFMATHLGGEEEDYDIMKGRSGIFVSQGEGTAWDYLNTNKANWEVVKDYVNLDSYIDYMLLNFYGGNRHDWYPQHNWVAGRRRVEGGKFNYFMWDNDFLVRRGGNSTTGSTADTTGNGGPGNMWSAFMQHDEFQIRVADRVQKHFYNDGMLTTERVQADFTELAERVSRTIIPESARWGTKADLLYTPDSFQTYVDWIVDVNAPTRTDVVLDQMKTAGFLPGPTAPSFSQHGGDIPSGSSLEITHTEGDLYYTTDGSDPRMPDGSVNPDAVAVGGALFPNTILPNGSTWKYNDSQVDPGGDWYLPTFDDSSWPNGATPMGFGGINNTTINTTVFSGQSSRTTFYCRRTFNVADPSNLLAASLSIKADDGFIAYLNGQEIVRNNMDVETLDVSTPASDSAGTNEGIFLPFSFDKNLLIAGENLICVEVHNSTPGNNDMVLDLELFGEDLNPNRFVTLNETGMIRTRTLDGGEWSGITEATFITDIPASSENLVISEIHYHPSDGQGTDSEFIELMNISNQTVSLSGVSFTEGITFSFEDQATIAPGTQIILVSDPIAFATNYGEAIPITGVYTSRLANNGERLTLTDANGIVIQTLRFNDRNPWPTTVDGLGYSLTLVAPLGNADPELPQNWRSSLSPGGTPNAPDSVPYTGNSDSELLLYATGTSDSPTLSFRDGLAIFEYQRQHGADSATMIVEVSTDLENWTTGGITFLSQSNLGNSLSKMSWSIPNNAGGPVFARLKASLIE